MRVQVCPIESADSVVLDQDVFLETWKRWKETRDRVLLDQMFLMHEKSATRVARENFKKYGLTFEDAEMVAQVALARCIERWDPDKGALMTLAWESMRRELRRTAEITRVRPTVRTQKKMQEIEAARDVLRKKIAREPTTKELAAHLGYREYRIVETEKAWGMRKVVSLDAPAKGAGEHSIGESISAPEREMDTVSTLVNEIRAYMATLKTDCDRAVVMHYTFADVLGCEKLSYTQLANMFGVKKQAIEQRVGRILKKLKRNCFNLFSIERPRGFVA